MPQIGIDYYYADKARIRGMARYVVNLRDAVESLVPISPRRSMSGWLSLGQPISRFFPAWEQLCLPAIVWGGNFRWFIFPYNTCPLLKPPGTRYAVVVHDVIFLNNALTPESWAQRVGWWYRRRLSATVARRADLIIAVSSTSRSAISREYGVEEAKIAVLYNTVSRVFEARGGAKSDRRAGYLLSVAGSAANKNLNCLLAAHREYRGKGGKLSLRVVGLTQDETSNWRRKLGAEANKSVCFEAPLSDAELVDMYRRASGFVFASIEEGFGIPLLEAMCCGVPIACSSTSCMPEITAGCALLFDPYSAADIARCMATLELDAAGNQMRVDAGIQRAKDFSRKAFEKSANELVAKMRKAAT